MINKKGQLIITWCANDVIDCAEQQDKKITLSQAKEILIQMDRYHDCNIGISWDVINCHIDMYLDSQIKKIKNEQHTFCNYERNSTDSHSKKRQPEF